jgi:hypothetical protein
MPVTVNEHRGEQRLGWRGARRAASVVGLALLQLRNLVAQLLHLTGKFVLGRIIALGTLSVSLRTSLV